MPEETTPQEGTTDTPEASEPKPAANLDTLPEWAREALTKANREAAKYRTDANALKGTAKELETLRQSAMSDQEKAVSQAKDEGRAQALAEVGTARAEDAIRFSVGERLPEDELDSILDVLNLAHFLTDDGGVDREKVTKYVERIAPTPDTTTVPDLGQGPRGGNGVAIDNTPRGLITAGLEANDKARKR